MSPSSRDWRLYADDIIEACEKIQRFTKGMSYEAFVADELKRDAVLRNIEIIGEAAKNLPDEVISGAPEVPWRQVRGMRDVWAHAYFGLETKVIWSIVTTQIVPLVRLSEGCWAEAELPIAQPRLLQLASARHRGGQALHPHSA